MIYVLGGGSVKLNFEVVGGTTQPSNPKENTIWVNTDVEIPRVVFYGGTPGAANYKVEGVVWIKEGYVTSPYFNALITPNSKTNFYCHPLYVYQYINGAWTHKPAMIYRGGAWVELMRYIFKDGKLNEITGFMSSKGTVSTGSVLKFTANSNDYGHWYSKEKIDLTNVNKLSVVVSGGMSWQWGNSPLIGVGTSVPSNNEGQISGLSAYKRLTSGRDGTTYAISSGTYEIDVANINTSVYLVASVISTSSETGSISISKITLE